MASETMVATEVAEEDVLGATITTIVDNHTAQPGLGNVWGLSLYIEIEFHGRTEAILMDTSGSAQVFRHNVHNLGLDFSNLRAIVISHFHSDHFGAIQSALDMIGHSELVAYLPGHHEVLETTFRKNTIRYIIAQEAQLIRSSVSTTGTLGSRTLKEHALVLNIESVGLVMLTGCAHPKVERLLQLAKKAFPDRSVHAVIGGFHLKTEEEGGKVGELFKQESVKLVSPCHCTTKLAKVAIRRIVGDHIYRENGSGTTFSIQ